MNTKMKVLTLKNLILCISLSLALSAPPPAAVAQIGGIRLPGRGPLMPNRLKPLEPKLQFSTPHWPIQLGEIYSIPPSSPLDPVKATPSVSGHK